MPVHLGTRIAGIAMEADNFNVFRTGALAAVRHHTVLIGVAVHGLVARGGTGLVWAFHVGEFHPAIRVHNALDAVGMGDAGHQNESGEKGDR